MYSLMPPGYNVLNCAKQLCFHIQISRMSENHGFLIYDLSGYGNTIVTLLMYLKKNDKNLVAG